MTERSNVAHSKCMEIGFHYLWLKVVVWYASSALVFPYRGSGSCYRRRGDPLHIGMRVYRDVRIGKRFTSSKPVGHRAKKQFTSVTECVHLTLAHSWQEGDGELGELQYGH